MSIQAKRFNERVKLLTTTANALAIGVAGSAIILPVVRESTSVEPLRTAIWIFVAFILHLMAQAVLGLLRSED